MAKQDTTQRARRSWALIGWAGLLLALGAGVAGLCVWAAISGASPVGGAAWLWPCAAAGGAVALTAAFFLALGLFVVRLGPRVSPLTNDQRLIVRAAAAMVLADRDATHVEIETLRVWIERTFGHQIAFDEIQRIAHDNANNRDAVVTAVADHHRSMPSWGKDDDEALISACASVLVADLRNRDEEVAYLRRLAEAVELDKARCDALVAKIKALELELEGLVVQALAARNDRQPVAA